MHTGTQHSPHKWIASKYGAKIQYSPFASNAPELDKRGITRVQSIAQNFLYITCAVDPDTVQKTKMLMDCAATQPDTVIQFHASDMCLHIDSNAAYLVQPKACSRAVGHY